jgi:LysM repeat protein
MNRNTTVRFLLTLICATVTFCPRAQTPQDYAEKHPIKNVSLLYPFFEKLAGLDENKEGKINIVHIGDSHIEADYFTNAIREPLQRQFGDGGRGFIFPYNMNRVSARPYQFTTNAAWQMCRNNQPLKCEPGTEFGLSGYGLGTKTEHFVFSVEASEERYNFNTIKIVSSTPASYNIVTVDGNKKPTAYSERTAVKFHRIKRRETIDVIAKKYNVSVAAIKKENKMKSNGVKAGSILRIPITITETSIDASVFRIVPVRVSDSLPAYLASYLNADGTRAKTREQRATASRSGKKIAYKVRAGETLYSISNTFGVTVEDLLMWNYMNRPRNLKAEQTLVIYLQDETTQTLPAAPDAQPTQTAADLRQRVANGGAFVSAYHQKNPVSAVYVLNTPKQALYSLNGLIVEKDAPGVIYHSIGTSGSAASHYNANPLFFEQLPALLPDLVIVSFGTNESFGEISAKKFIASIEQFVNNTKNACGDIPILVTTPPISLLRRKRPNTYISEYSGALSSMGDVAVWDLYAFTKGLVGANGDFAAIKISGDNVHYTADGYINQGTAFVNVLLDEYKKYKNTDNDRF